MEIKNLTFAYPLSDQKIFDGLTLSVPVEPGEIVALKAPSGAGKTTLLRLLAGLEIPASGTIECPPCAFLFQEDRLIPRLNARSQLRAVLPSATTDAAVAADIDSYLTLVDLQDDADTLVEELSGGMKRRLALARAIAFAKETGRELLLLDEPFTGVDAARITSILASLRRLNFRVFLTAHEESILALADRVIALESKG
ncbi:MAG: ATP-binding cassette domain-containing protein [Firmicutes bacterium]|nr:ATP-binding cassette domain-containing protein [Bacillota bacterium]